MHGPLETTSGARDNVCIKVPAGNCSQPVCFGDFGVGRGSSTISGSAINIVLDLGQILSYISYKMMEFGQVFVRTDTLVQEAHIANGFRCTAVCSFPPLVVGFGMQYSRRLLRKIWVVVIDRSFF